MPKLVEVKPVDGLLIYLKYSNGVEGEFSLERTAAKKEYEILKEDSFFKKVYIDSKTNDVTWGEGLSLCKNAIYKQLELKSLMKSLKLDLEKI